MDVDLNQSDYASYDGGRHKAFMRGIVGLEEQSLLRDAQIEIGGMWDTQGSAFCWHGYTTIVD